MTQAPARILGWQAADLAGDQRWIFAANPRLAQATEAELQAWLAPVRQELKLGWGVAWIRGLGALPEAQLRRLYLAIGRGLGKPDTTYGELYDVTDTGACHLQRAIPVSQTRAATTMHTDSSQRTTHPRWVGLACVSQAPEGGGSGLASAVAVHDHLACHQPQALRRLHRCFHRALLVRAGGEGEVRGVDRLAVGRDVDLGARRGHPLHTDEDAHVSASSGCRRGRTAAWRWPARR
jgi:hypothetical protein